LFVYTSEEGALLFSGDAGTGEIGVHVRFSVLMRVDFVTVATFLVEPEPKALAVLIIIVNSHVGDGRDTGEAVDHHTD